MGPLPAELPVQEAERVRALSVVNTHAHTHIKTPQVMETVKCIASERKVHLERTSASGETGAASSRGQAAAVKLPVTTTNLMTTDVMTQ